MAKPRITDQSSSDDDAPEVVSKILSRTNAKRDQKALRSFEAEQNARKKAQNRERDRKLKERALSKRKKERPNTKLQHNEASENEGSDRSSPEGGSSDGGDGGHIRERMLRAMQDAVEEDDSDEYDGEFGGGSADLMSGGSEAEDDPDTVMRLEQDSSSIADSEEVELSFKKSQPGRLNNTTRQPRTREPQYLSDELFAAAFASSKQKPAATETRRSTQSKPTETCRRKRPEGPKDIILGGRTFRTLTKLSDPKSKATARTLPSAHVQKFVESNLALGGDKTAMLRAKKKGWERRPANVGAMKPDGAPSAFCRSAVA
ncbi:hypothetical protein EDC04DRAFT_148066 [Pisolithus marmoratus]|nr:hypothetical protein EDC04DRAFT_148066 [Pisolithus marmoratus]